MGPKTRRGRPVFRELSYGPVRAQEKEKRMGLYVWVGSTIDAAKISAFTACSSIWTLGPNNPTERAQRMYEMAGQILASDQSKPHRGEAARNELSMRSL